MNDQTPQTGFYLGFIVWGRSRKWLKVTNFLGGPGACPPQNFFEMNMRWDAICCILRHNCEKCYCVCIDLIANLNSSLWQSLLKLECNQNFYVSCLSFQGSGRIGRSNTTTQFICGEKQNYKTWCKCLLVESKYEAKLFLERFKNTLFRF